jgi:DNA repair protein RadC
MPIHQWPADERPREKLINVGASNLSDAELLAIFLRVGVTGKSAVDLARDLLSHFGGLGPLAQAPVNQIATVHGMGIAKAAQLHAAIELSRRALAAQAKQVDVLGSPELVRQHLRLTLGAAAQEVFWAMYLDNGERNDRVSARTRETRD